MLDEAKNMIQLEKYHDHIVNLQGLTCEVNKGNHHLSTVRVQIVNGYPNHDFILHVVNSVLRKGLMLFLFRFLYFWNIVPKVT